jgi:hypothetical protein
MSIFSSTQQRISLEHPNEPLLICALNKPGQMDRAKPGRPEHGSTVAGPGPARHASLWAVPARPIIPCRGWANASARGLARHGTFTVACRHGTAQAWHGPPAHLFSYDFLIFPIYFSYFLFFFHILSYLYHIFYDIFPKFSSHLSYIYHFFLYIMFFLPFFFFFPQISIFMGHMY